MNKVLGRLLALAPIVAVAYFARLGSSSITLFDFYSAILLLGALVVMPLRELLPVSAAWYVFVTGSLVGLVATVANETMSNAIDFIPSAMRYLQMFLIAAVVAWAARSGKVRRFRFEKPLFLLAMVLPLGVGLFFLHYAPQTVTMTGRFSSYFGNPNAVGGFICIAVPAVNLTLSRSSFFVKSIFGTTFYVLAVIALIYSGSIGGMILFCVSLAVSIISLISVSRRIVLIAISVVVSAVLFAYFFGHPLQQALISSDYRGLKRAGELLQVVFNGSSIRQLGSGQMRSVLLLDSLKIYISSPLTFLFGVGFGQLPYLMFREYGYFYAAHNAYVVLLLDTGIVGIGFFLSVFVHLWKKFGATLATLGIMSGYFLAMLQTPAVYLPFLWCCWVFGLYVNTNCHYKTIKRVQLENVT